MSAPTTGEERHVLATRALLRARQGQVLAGHHSGLVVLGLPTYRADLTQVRLSRRTPGPMRQRVGYRLGRAVPVDAQLAETVTPAVAVVQHGLSTGPLSALVAADAALHRGVVSRTDLDGALDWARYHPRSVAVKRFVALADGRRESPGETRLAHALHLMGVPATPQAKITAPGFTAYVDLLLDGEDVVLEFDGQVKYGRSADQPDPYGHRRSPQQVLWAEKQRGGPASRARLRGGAGHLGGPRRPGGPGGAHPCGGSPGSASSGRLRIAQVGSWCTVSRPLSTRADPGGSQPRSSST